MPATIGATVRRPKAGNVQQTSGNSSSTGRRRARRSAARRRVALASSPSRRRVSPSGTPLRRWSVIAWSSGRAGSPHSVVRSASASMTGTPRSIESTVAMSPGLAVGGAHRARTGRAVGIVIPAPIESRRRSITSGRSWRTGAGPALARRILRQRRASDHAPKATSVGTTPTSTHAPSPRTHRPTHASRRSSGARPAAVRRIRPIASSGRGRGAGLRTPTRPTLGRVAMRGPTTSSTAITAATERIVGVTRPAAPAGASTSHRGRRGRPRRRCTPNPQGCGAGIAPTRDRPSRAGT